MGFSIVPEARALAEELGVDVSTVQGSGPDGRIEVADVRFAHLVATDEDPWSNPFESAPESTVHRGPGGEPSTSDDDGLDDDPDSPFLEPLSIPVMSFVPPVPADERSFTSALAMARATEVGDLFPTWCSLVYEAFRESAEDSSPNDHDAVPGEDGERPTEDDLHEIDQNREWAMRVRIAKRRELDAFLASAGPRESLAGAEKLQLERLESEVREADQVFTVVDDDHRRLYELAVQPDGANGDDIDDRDAAASEAFLEVVEPAMEFMAVHGDAVADWHRSLAYRSRVMDDIRGRWAAVAAEVIEDNGLAIGESGQKDDENTDGCGSGCLSVVLILVGLVWALFSGGVGTVQVAMLALGAVMLIRSIYRLGSDSSTSAAKEEARRKLAGEVGEELADGRFPDLFDDDGYVDPAHPFEYPSLDSLGAVRVPEVRAELLRVSNPTIRAFASKAAEAVALHNSVLEELDPQVSR